MRPRFGLEAEQNFFPSCPQIRTSLNAITIPLTVDNFSAASRSESPGRDFGLEDAQ